MKPEQHEVTAACQEDHCHSCQVDEPGTGYILCGECGHLYRTARDLRRAYRRIVWEFWREDHHWRTLWKILTVRASRIYFCQECIHDF